MKITDITYNELYALKTVCQRRFLNEDDHSNLDSLLDKLIILRKQDNQNPSYITGNVVGAEVMAYDPTVINVTVKMTIPSVTIGSSVEVTFPEKVTHD